MFIAGSAASERGSHLLFTISSFASLGGSALGAGTSSTLDGPGVTEGLEGQGGGLLGGDLAGRFHRGILSDRHDLLQIDLGGEGAGSGGARTLLLAGDHHKAVEVGQQALLVELQGLFASVAATMVNSDTNGAGIGSSQSGSLKDVLGPGGHHDDS